MRRALLTFFVISVSTLAAATLVARQRPAITWDYLELSPGYMDFPATGQSRTGYWACLAGSEGWQCRRFEDPMGFSLAPGGTTDTALRQALTALGTEGWEMVSALDGDNVQLGKTYLFKRQRQ